MFLHLLPHAFNSHDHDHGLDEKLHTHVHEGGDEKKSVLIGTGIFAGLFFFYAADKFMRAYLGRSGHDHSHGHAHDHAFTNDNKKNEDQQVVDQVAVREGLRQRNINNSDDAKYKENTKSEKDSQRSHNNHHHHDEATKKTDVKASTYLNLLADFTHNLTDGIAMAASFYASPAVGATTAVAVFFHEIPHEVSDYAILLQSGFSKKRAMMAQFTTAVGAYIGTFIGIFIEEMATRLSHQGQDSHNHHHHSHGLLGTSMTWGDLIIPVTAGGFLYIATVGVIPELLEAKTTSKLQPLKELAAMVFGMALMAGIALNESHHH